MKWDRNNFTIGPAKAGGMCLKLIETIELMREISDFKNSIIELHRNLLLLIKKWHLKHSQKIIIYFLFETIIFSEKNCA